MRLLTATSPTPVRPAGRLLSVSIGLLPLVCWPGLDRPFSLPKLWLIGGLGLLIAIQHLARKPDQRRAPGWPWWAFLAAIGLSAASGPYVSLEALLLAALPMAFWGAEIGSMGPLRAGSAIESAIVLLQYFGQDPFQWLGWRPEAFGSPRMRIYGTLGNPDFVAAWLCATLPLWVGARGAVAAALAAAQLGAIFATQSRIFLLALPAAGIVLAARGRQNAKWAIAGVPAACALLWFAEARPLDVTVRGRLYLATVTLAHVREIPVAGFGPGSFGLKFSEWQAAWLRDHKEDRPFAGPVDHAHNDYLEFWVEYGPLGLCAFLALCGWLVSRAWRSPPVGGAPAAIVALLAIACADFPFHRPAAWALFSILAAFSEQTRRMPSCPSRSSE